MPFVCGLLHTKGFLLILQNEVGKVKYIAANLRPRSQAAAGTLLSESETPPPKKII